MMDGILDSCEKHTDMDMSLSLQLASSSVYDAGSTVNRTSSLASRDLRDLTRPADSDTRPSRDTSSTVSVSVEETEKSRPPRVLLTASPPTRVSTSSNSRDL